MGEEKFRVIFIKNALADLEELHDYWHGRGEAWRAEKYHRDLVHRAEIELSDPAGVRRGRRSKSRLVPSAQEILAFGVYRIIYVIDETAATVRVLRFWHTHRDEPGRDA